MKKPLIKAQSILYAYVFIVLGIYNFGFWLDGRAGNCAVTNYFYDSVLRFFAAILSLLNCSFMPRNSHHVRQSWQTTKASFHNGSVIVLKGGIQQRRGLNYTQFWPPTLLESTIVKLLHTILLHTVFPHIVSSLE